MITTNLCHWNLHEKARPHKLFKRKKKFNKATVRHVKNPSYDKQLVCKQFTIGASIWLHNARKNKGRNAKLDCPREGPYLVISVLSDVVYRIQKAKTKVVHSDQFKPYMDMGPPTGEISRKFLLDLRMLIVLGIKVPMK